MRDQNKKSQKTVAFKKLKTTTHRISKFQPTEVEIEKALAQKKPQAGDIAAIQSIQIPDEPDNNTPIVFSETWYEFSVFARKIGLHPKTVNKWLKKGWLAYSEIGKVRLINKADIEDMMLHFRKPAIFLLSVIVSLLNDLKTCGLFVESISA